MSQLHVVFGAGSLGSAVQRALLAGGHKVRAVSRSGRGALPGAEVHRADASDPAQARTACAGAAAVYNCAAPPYTDWPRLYPALQKGLVEGAAAAGAVLVSAENVYVYGRVDGPMTEDTPMSPCSRKGELRARMHEELMAAHRAGTVRVAVGRGPDYYGPEAVVTTVYGERVFYSALAGKPADIFGDPDARHTWAYVDDFARGLVTLGTRPEAVGKAWHLPCPPPLKQRDMIDLIYRAAGHPPKLRAMPGFMLKMLGWFIPIMRELAEMEYQWRMDYDFRCDRFLAAFGGGFVPHEQGVRQTLAWFKANPKP